MSAAILVLQEAGLQTAHPGNWTPPGSKELLCVEDNEYDIAQVMEQITGYLRDAEWSKTQGYLMEGLGGRAPCMKAVKEVH